MSKSLFSDFESVSSKQWKQKIQVDLKGADYNETLLWQSLEGIHVKPFYHSDDFETPPRSIPGHPAQWKIAQTVFIDKTHVARSLALDAISRGAECIEFIADEEFEIQALFEGFNFEECEIRFRLNFLKQEFYADLIRFLKSNKASAKYSIDLLGNLAQSGNWFHSNEKDHQILTELLSGFPDASILGVNSGIFQNAGANMVQQIAYSVAQATEYLHFIEERNVKNTNNTINPSITFNVSIGSNYFFEIAKIRALRLVYASIASEFGFEPKCDVFAKPSFRNKTIYDYNMNMLRTTTECMSGILGGANTIGNLAYDAVYHKSNEFGERISRNQLLILKSESYFDTVENTADGSYYVEKLTDELAEKSLALFKEIEHGGGFLKMLRTGTLQKKIKENADKELRHYDSGDNKLVGTTHFINDQDQMKDELELYPFLKTNVRKTEVEPIIPKRISEKVEQERLDNE